MIPFTAHDAVRLVADEARSALADAPVRPEPVPSTDPRRSGSRWVRLRFEAGAALRWLADRVEPVCQPTPTVADSPRR